MNLEQTALELASRGYSVVPTRADGSKAPAGDWKRWQQETATPEQLQRWLTSGSFDGIGLVCGAVSGNLEMLELEGRACLQGIPAQLADIANASSLGELWARVVTGYSETSPSGGIHFLYRVQGDVAGNTKLARRTATDEELAVDPQDRVKVLIETRGEGGYVVIAPSNGRTHPSGKPWSLLAGGVESIPTLAADERDALHILCQSVDAMPSAETTPPRSSEISASSNGPNVADDYNTRTTWDHLLVARGWVKLFTSQGATYWRRPGKNRGISATTGRNNGDNLFVFSTSTDFESETPYSKFAAFALLEQGGDLSAAGKALYKAGYGQRDKNDDVFDLPKAADTTDTKPPDEPPADPEADLSNARWLVAMHGQHMRYVMPWKKWLIWDGARWATDDTGQAIRYAKQVADTLPKKHKGRTARSQTKAGIRDMLELASTEPGVAISPVQLDADPYMFNVTNGTVDLRTGELQPHNPDDLITKVAGADYDPDAQAPEFAKFLERVQPAVEMRNFLARLFGHALLGRIVEHVLAICYGTGANGKTTLVEAVTHVFGDYARPMEPGLLIDRGDVHPTGTAALFGCRLAITHESDEGRRLAEGTVKRLTGGDKITARRMREDFWDFEPSHSIIMHTNHKPIVRGTDEGIWRRLRFIPFNIVIPENERDGKLPERLQAESTGILAWIIAGYRQWLDRGLAEPEAVTKATSEFRGESDLLMSFLEERCRLDAGPHATIQSSELFAAWVGWCKKENVEAGSQKAFTRQMAERGYDKKKNGIGRMVWVGIGLYTEEMDT